MEISTPPEFSETNPPESKLQDRIMSLMQPVMSLAQRKDALIAGIAAAALIVGFAAGRMGHRGDSGSAAADLSRAQWVRSANGSFEVALLPGWENISAEANMGVAAEGLREAVLREKSASGSRLFAIQPFNAGKKDSREKTRTQLAVWIVEQKDKIKGLQKEMNIAQAEGSTPGMPVILFERASAPGAGGGSGIFTGIFIFKGSFYEYSFATSYPRDAELLSSLLGSIREAQRGVAAPKPALTPAPGKPKKSAKAKKS